MLNKKTNKHKTRPARSASWQDAVVRKRYRGHHGLGQRTWLLMLVLFFSAIAAWWRYEKIQVGYCKAGQPAWSLSGIVPDWVDRAIAPRCETCPLHASCHPQFRVECDEDYLMKARPLSLGGLVPLPPRCDGARGRPLQVQKLAEQIVAELRRRQSARGQSEWEDWIQTIPKEGELKATILRQNHSVHNTSTIDVLWKDALAEGVARKDIRRIQFGPTPHLTLLSATAAAPSFLEALWHWFQQLVCVVFQTVLFGGLLCICGHRQDAAQLEHLVTLTLDRIREQARQHMYSPDEPRSIPVRHLIGQLSIGQPRRLAQWKARIRQNRHIRCTGEGDSETWEWAGQPDILD